MGALVDIGALIGVLCASEALVKRCPRLEARIERWLAR